MATQLPLFHQIICFSHVRGLGSLVQNGAHRRRPPRASEPGPPAPAPSVCGFRLHNGKMAAAPPTHTPGEMRKKNKRSKAQCQLSLPTFIRQAVSFPNLHPLDFLSDPPLSERMFGAGEGSHWFSRVRCFFGQSWEWLL